MFLVKVQGIDGFFAKKTGGEISSENSKAWDGGSLFPDNLTGPGMAANIIVSRVFDPARDNGTIVSLRQQVGKFVTTISSTPTDRDLNAVADPAVYPQAVLVALREPDYDAGSGDAAEYELEFAINAFQ
jgi:hypothetical protein